MRCASSVGVILLPAVDIRDGKAVRLRQGHFDEETVYADDPLEAARSFVEAGARFLHVVDLDGAREGEPVNLHHVERITRELEVPVEHGGGLRSIASIRRALKAGRRSRRARHRGLHRPRLARRGARGLHRARAGRGRRARRQGVRLRLDARDADARRGRDPADAGTRRDALRLHQRRPRRDARGPRPGRDPAGRGGRPRALPLLGRDRLAGRPAGAARPAAREPRRRDLGQGPLRAPLHGRRGPAGRWTADAAAPGHPLPRRRQGPRGQGRRVRRPPRRRRPRRAGRPLPGRGRRRDRLPRHHGLARAARDGRRAGPPLRRRRLHPVHDRRRRALGRGRPGRARRRRRQGVGQLRRGRAARAARRDGRRCSAPSAWCWRSTPAARLDGDYERLRRGRPQAGRARRGRVGARGRRARRGRDPADQHGPRRHRGRLRARADARGVRRRRRAGDRQRRRRHARPPGRRRRAGRRRRGAVRVDLPLRAATRCARPRSGCARPGSRCRLPA